MQSSVFHMVSKVGDRQRKREDLEEEKWHVRCARSLNGSAEAFQNVQAV